MFKWLKKYGSWILIAILAIYVVNRYIQFQPDLTNGTVAENFSFVGLDGSEYELSDFDGKYVWIDFWGSWCPPCRRANPKWAATYQELKNSSDYNGDMIEFISVASETNPQSWRKAMEKDGLEWNTQFIDVRNENSVIDLYGVNSFPTNYLIDPNGIIIGVNVSPKFVKRRLEVE